MAESNMQSVAQELPVETGVERKDRRKLSEMLTQIVASTHVLYGKVRGVHWNVVGPSFYSLHKMTEEQYEDLHSANDDMAERIRAIGFNAPTGLSTMIKNSIITDETELLSTEEMIRELVEDHEKMAKLLREGVNEADSVDDPTTADMLTARIGVHEEAAWMLRATLA